MRFGKSRVGIAGIPGPVIARLGVALLRCASSALAQACFGAVVEFNNPAPRRGRMIAAVAVLLTLFAQVPTPSFGQLKSLGVTDVKVTVSAVGYKSPTDNLPDLAYSASLNPPDEKIVASIKALASVAHKQRER